MKNKILNIFIVLVMLINVFAFSACSNSELETKIAELEEQITELEQENEDLQASVTEQQGKIDELQEENEDLQSNIPGLIEQYKELDENAEFLLYISTPQKEYESTDDIYVDVILYNLSNKTYKIDDIAFVAESPTGGIVFDLGKIYKYPTIEKDAVIIENCFIGYYVFFKPGTHELYYCAKFFINYEQPNEEYVEVKSNTIIVTVLDK